MKPVLAFNCKESVDAHERPKDYLTLDEMGLLLAAAKKGRWGSRDHLLILLMFRHGLRVTEAINLRIKDVNMKHARMWVQRQKNGLSVEHPMEPDELRALKRHLAGRQEGYIFLSERGGPLTRQGAYLMIHKAGIKAGFTYVHPHTLRHSCGYYLTNSGTPLRTIQDYLGHRWISTTVRYTRTAAIRFEGLWRK